MKRYTHKIEYVDNEGWGKITLESSHTPLSVEEAVRVIEAETEAKGTMIDKFEVKRKWL